MTWQEHSELRHAGRSFTVWSSAGDKLRYWAVTEDRDGRGSMPPNQATVLTKKAAVVNWRAKMALEDERAKADPVGAFMAANGRKGGTARAANLTAEQRSKAASKAASARVYEAKCACGECPTCIAREYQRKRRENKAT